MSIVERAAKRIGTAPKPDPKPSVQDEAIGAHAADPVRAVAEAREPHAFERAIVTDSGQSRTVDGEYRADGAEGFAAGIHSGPETAASSRMNGRILDIELKWLRQQHMITPDSDRTPIAEGFRRIKRHILANVAATKAGAAPNLVMITSALPGEGKTFCAINLAISIAMELDRTVLLVDADMVRPSVLPGLGLKAGLPGLMDVLNDSSIDLADVLHRTSIEKLSILPAGSPHRHATEMLASESMRTLIRELAERYDDRIVIFDSPPLLVSSEAAVLATHMSQIVLVVAAGETTEVALKDALKRVEGCGHVGLLLNKGRASRAGYYGYDGYG